MSLDHVRGGTRRRIREDLFTYFLSACMDVIVDVRLLRTLVAMCVCVFAVKSDTVVFVFVTREIWLVKVRR